MFHHLTLRLTSIFKLFFFLLIIPFFTPAFAIEASPTVLDEPPPLPIPPDQLSLTEAIMESLSEYPNAKIQEINSEGQWATALVQADDNQAFWLLAQQLPNYEWRIILPTEGMKYLLFLEVIPEALLSNSEKTTIQSNLPAIDDGRLEVANSTTPNWETYRDPYWDFTISYPEDWTLQNIAYRDFGFRISSPDNEVSAVGNPLTGAFLSVNAIPMNIDEWNLVQIQNADRIDIFDSKKLAILVGEGYQFIGFDRKGNYFIENIIFNNNFLYQFRFIQSSNDFSNTNIGQTILSSVQIHSSPKSYPPPDYDSLGINIDDFEFLPLKIPRENGTWQIPSGGGYINNIGTHRGGDLYALDFCSASGACENHDNNHIAVAPTDIKFVANDSTDDDFKFFELDKNDQLRFCMSLGHFDFRAFSSPVEKGAIFPRGAVLGTLSDYVSSTGSLVPHMHMGIFTVPISSQCNYPTDRIAYPYEGNANLDGVDYPCIGTCDDAYKNTLVTSTNFPICADPIYESENLVSQQEDASTILQIEDCIGSGGGGDDLNPPTLNSPGSGETLDGLTVDFSWSSPNSPNQNGYTFRLNTSSNPDSTPWIVDTGLGNEVTSYSHTFDSEGTYYWHMRTWNSSNEPSAWVTRQFHIDDSPSEVNLCTSDNASSGCTPFSVGVYSSLSDFGLNDQIRSVIVPSGRSVFLFRESGLKGTAECFSGNRAPLPSGNPWDLRGEVSSLQVFNTSGCPTSQLFSVVMYDNQNFGSHHWGVGKDEGLYNLGSLGGPDDEEFNDHAESMRIPNGWSVIVYGDANGMGPVSSCLTGDVTSLGSLNNIASSVRIFHNENCTLPAPKPPTNPTILGTTETTVTLGWTDESDDETQFHIYRWDTQNGVTDFYYFDSVGANITSYTDTTVGCDQIHYYTVSAVNGGSESAQTGWVTAVTQPCPDTQAPTVSWVEPVTAENTFFVGDQEVLLKADASDNVAVDYVKFDRWDAVNLITVPIQDDFTNPYEVIINTADLNYEWNQINTYAYDTAGNVSQREIIWLYRYRCQDNNEMNNDFNSTTPIGYGQTISADICGPGDTDHYRFSGVAGDQIVIDIDAQAIGSNLDSVVHLFNSDGSVAYTFADDSGGSADSLLIYSLPTTGSYVIQVKDLQWNGDPNYFYEITLYNDTDAPTVEIVSPVTGNWLNPTIQTIEAVASDATSGVNRVDFFWHDNDWVNSDWIFLGGDSNGSDGWQIQMDTSNIPEQEGGTYFVYVYDNYGNYGSHSVNDLGIDRTVPESSIEGVPPTISDTSFFILWTGSDNLSGIDNNSYEIQVRDGLNGSWQNFDISNASYNLELFTGEDGHTYYFRSRVRDNAGNLEPYTTSWDAVTTIDTSLADCFTVALDNTPLEGGTINASPAPNCNDTQYLNGTTVEFTATPNDGFTFDEWAGDSSSTDASISLTITDNVQLQAIYESTCHELTLTVSGGNGIISTSPEPNCTNGEGYLHDTNVTLTAVPDLGYTFSTWGGSASGNIATTSLNIDSDKTAIAVLQPSDCFDVELFTSPANGGNIQAIPSPNCNNGSQYHEGTIIQLTAQPSSDFAFVNWLEDASGTSSVLSIQVDNDLTIGANFAVDAGGTAKPTLDIPDNILGYVNSQVTVPINFESTDESISSAVFSINYDEDCLFIDTTDSNNDGIPDAIEFSDLNGFTLSALLDINDKDGEIDISILDVSTPLATLPSGPLMTVRFGVNCDPGFSTREAPIRFGTEPTPSLGNTKGQAIPALFLDGFVEVSGTTFSGDCNEDQLIDAGDISALVLEIFDGDGSDPANAHQGTFEGGYGCDANNDLSIDAGDISCAVLVIFNGSDACTVGPLASLLDWTQNVEWSPETDGPKLSIPSGTVGKPGQSVTLPIDFTHNDHNISIVAFSINYDDNLLNFDPTDANNDGIPDSISFNLPNSFSGSVVVQTDDDDGEIDVLVSDTSLPFASLPNGTLINISFDIPEGNTEGLEASVAFSQSPIPSFGNTSGQSVPGTIENGSIFIQDNFEIFLPLVTK